MCGASGAGASPGDGVFVPVSPVYLLTRPNRMTVSLGTRVGKTSTKAVRRGKVGNGLLTSQSAPARPGLRD
jgi:hypothetical protein